VRGERPARSSRSLPVRRRSHGVGSPRPYGTPRSLSPRPSWNARPRRGRGGLSARLPVVASSDAAAAWASNCSDGRGSPGRLRGPGVEPPAVVRPVEQPLVSTASTTPPGIHPPVRPPRGGSVHAKQRRDREDRLTSGVSRAAAGDHVLAVRPCPTAWVRCRGCRRWAEQHARGGLVGQAVRGQQGLGVLQAERMHVDGGGVRAGSSASPSYGRVASTRTRGRGPGRGRGTGEQQGAGVGVVQVVDHDHRGPVAAARGQQVGDGREPREPFGPMSRRCPRPAVALRPGPVSWGSTAGHGQSAGAPRAASTCPTHLEPPAVPARTTARRARSCPRRVTRKDYDLTAARVARARTAARAASSSSRPTNVSTLANSAVSAAAGHTAGTPNWILSPWS